MGWSDTLQQLQLRGEAHVLVTVIGTRGSTPRESGSKMVVTGEESFDTIGGGNLEFQAIRHARELLCTGESSQSLQQFPLGATLGQCCGGHATLLFEHFAATGARVLVFGAGHVARALVPLLSQLPLRVEWIDNREGQFPAQVPDGIDTLLTDDPVEYVEQAKPGSYLLVLTHNHQLDYELTEAALKRDDLGFLGVIGSQTKARRFRQRLSHRGFDKTQIARFVCPIGFEAIPGKRPMEVAISIAGQLIARYQQGAGPRPVRQGVDWHDLQAMLDSDPETKTNQEQ